MPLLEDETRLFDLRGDPVQEWPLSDPRIEARMAELMRDLMAANEAPAEAFTRLELNLVAT